jgi:hypothetical protein
LQTQLRHAIELIPRLWESTKLGPFTTMEMVPLAKQYHQELLSTVEDYNDLSLMSMIEDIRENLEVKDE